MRFDEVIRSGDEQTLKNLLDWLSNGSSPNYRLISASSLRLAMQLNPPNGKASHIHNSLTCDECEDLAELTEEEVRKEYEPENISNLVEKEISERIEWTE